MALVSCCLIFLIGTDFFPTVDAGQIRLHVRNPPGTRIEQTEEIFGNVERAIRKDIPASEIDTHAGQHGDSQQLDQSVAQRRIADVAGRRRNPDLPQAGTSTHDRLHGPPVRRPAQAVPGPDVLFPAGRHRDPGAEFRDRRPHRRSDRRAAATMCPETFRSPRGFSKKSVRCPARRMFASSKCPMRRMYTSTSIAPWPAKSASPSSRSPTICSFHSAAPPSCPRISGSIPVTGIQYSVLVQTPQYKMDTMSDLTNTPIVPPAPAKPRPWCSRTQLLGNLADVEPGSSPSNITHYQVRPTYDVLAGVRHMDLGSVADGVDKIVADARKLLPRGSSIIDPRAGPKHARVVRGHVLRPGLRDHPGLSAHGHQFPILARPAHHPHGAAGRARGHSCGCSFSPAPRSTFHHSWARS